MEGDLDESHYHSFYSSGDVVSQTLSEGDGSAFEESVYLNGAPSATFSADDSFGEEKMTAGFKAESRHPPPGSWAPDSLEDSPLVAMTLYTHRVNSLVLALLVEPGFMSDTASLEEVVRRSMFMEMTSLQLITKDVFLFFFRTTAAWLP